MNNILTIAELKRRGMAAIEEGLLRGPVHIVKRPKHEIDKELAARERAW